MSENNKEHIYKLTVNGKLKYCNEKEIKKVYPGIMMDYFSTTIDHIIKSNNETHAEEKDEVKEETEKLTGIFDTDSAFMPAQFEGHKFQVFFELRSSGDVKEEVNE